MGLSNNWEFEEEIVERLQVNVNMTKKPHQRLKKGHLAEQASLA